MAQDSEQRPMSTLEGRFAALAAAVTACNACPRLVAWREEVAHAAPDGVAYWSKPLPGFGDPGARVLVVGLAPAARGGNRTGRVFTGDRSGDVLFAALHRAGFANQPESVGLDDGLSLADAFVTAAVRCAPPENRPTPLERDTCRHFLDEEIDLLERLRVVVALGAFAFDAVLRSIPATPARSKPRFSHGAEVPLSGGRVLLCSYHPSQRNVFTGRLTTEMLDTVFSRARALADEPAG